MLSLYQTCVFILFSVAVAASNAQSPTLGDSPTGAPFAQADSPQDSPPEPAAPPAATDEAAAEDPVPDAPTADELQNAKAAESNQAAGNPDAEPANKEAPGQLSVKPLKIEPLEPAPTATAPEEAPTMSVDTARDNVILDDRKPYLGIIGGSRTARVIRVKERTAAALAGFHVDDVILAVDAKPVRGFDEFLAEVEKRLPGDSIDVVVQRGKQRISLFVILGAKVVR